MTRLVLLILILAFVSGCAFRETRSITVERALMLIHEDAEAEWCASGVLKARLQDGICR